MERAEDVGLRRAAHVGRYQRPLAVTLDRLFENALDWEHLPWLHASTFRSVELLESVDDTWRAEVGRQPDGHRLVIELALDRAERRWVTTTLEGLGAGSQIWTDAVPVGAGRTDVVVDFYVPGVPDDRRAALGQFYCDLYRHLYDEDEWMMTERQRQLDARRARRAGGEAPAFRIVEVGGARYAHGVVCPHLLGPLGDVPVIDGVVQCPWHGYRYDVRTGAECSGRPYRLPTSDTSTRPPSDRTGRSKRS